MHHDYNPNDQENYQKLKIPFHLSGRLVWYENLQAEGHTDLLRCPWLCFGFEAQGREWGVGGGGGGGAGGIEKGEL